MNTKKIIMGVIVIVVIIVAIVFGAQPKDPSAIRVGFIGALSGDAASFGESEKNATEIAVNEINNSGGINGRPLEIIYEDGKCTGKDALTAIQKLISVDLVKIVLGGTCSSETLAMAPTAEESKTILFSAFSSSPLITNAGDYTFRNGPSDEDVTRLEANTISKEYHKVAMISENLDYSQGVRKVMTETFAKNGTEIVADEVYNGSIKDFRSIFTKIKASNPDVIYLNPGSDTQAGGLMVKQARELGINTPIHGNFSLISPEAVAIGGKYMNGVVSVDSVRLSPKRLALLEKYKTLYKASPPIEFEMGSAYDRVYIIKQAIENVGTNPTKIKNYLYKMSDFDGTIGKYHFDKNGDVVGASYLMVKFQDGQKIPYNQ